MMYNATVVTRKSIQLGQGRSLIASFNRVNRLERQLEAAKRRYWGLFALADGESRAALLRRYVTQKQRQLQQLKQQKPLS